MIGTGCLVSGSATVAGARRDRSHDRKNVVSKEQAKKAVKAKLPELSSSPGLDSWENVALGSGSTVYLKTGTYEDEQPSGHVFPIRSQGTNVGYVTASARADWRPILEFSPATPPTELVGQARATAAESGFEPTDRIIYHGGVKYGLELSGGKAMNVRSGNVEPITVGSPAEKQFDPAVVSQEWDEVTGSSASSSISGQSSNFGWVYGVPAWTEHDDGGANSTSYGPGDDAWANWDGCVPVAASMIIAYHEGVSSTNDAKREEIIDRLHDSMNTKDGEKGLTDPWNIDDGFDDYTWGSEDYSGRNIYTWETPDFEKQEIDNDRPFLLNMTSGGTAEDRNDDYGNHTVCVVGYKNDADYLALHDTWDDTFHYLSWGSWTACSYTKVTTQ